MRKIQQLSIDGIGVELSKARFADTFDVADGDERLLAFDEEVVYVVVARVSTPSFRESKNGEVSRVNVLKVKEARLVKDEIFKSRVLDKGHFDYRPQPSLFDSLEEPEAEPSVEDLAEAGVRVRTAEPEEPVETEYSLLVEAGMDPDPEPDAQDDEMQKFLALTREIADEYDLELDEAADQDLGRREGGKFDARGSEKDDPVLARFLSL